MGYFLDYVVGTWYMELVLPQTIEQQRAGPDTMEKFLCKILLNGGIDQSQSLKRYHYRADW